MSTSSFSSNSDSVLSLALYPVRESKTYLKLVLDLGEFFAEDPSLAHARVNLLFQNLRPPLENLHILGLSFVTDAVAFVVLHDAFRANVDVVVLAEVLSLLVGVLGTELLLGVLFVLLFLLLRGHVLLGVEVVENGEVLD